MNVLTLPRSVAAIEYKALRLPATVLQEQLVARFLDEESKLRLGFERALGSLDEKAGTLLANDGLSERGRLLRRRSEILGKAVELEAVADQRKAAAEVTLREGRKKAEKSRAKAQKTQRTGVQKALRDEQAAKARVERDAAARVEAEKARVEQQADAKVESVAQQLDLAESRIEQKEKARTAAPKAQLEDAVAQKRAADAERAKAERLSDLADAERDARKAARG